MGFSTFDVWDQALLTTVIQRPAAGRAPGAAEDAPFLGEQIAPFTSLPGRNARVRVSELKPFGTGQFRAPDATPPLFKPAVAWREVILELVLIDEMERIQEEDWMKLHSSDENVRVSAGASLVDRGRILQLRNQRATEKLRWQAFSGLVTVTYPTGSVLQVDYGMAATHKPTVSTLWTNTSTADPVADIQAWSEVLAADSGFYGNRIHMNSKTYDLLIRNDKVKNAINFYAPSANVIFRPRREDLLNLFTSFATNVEIVIYDNGYREVGTTGVGVGSITKYLPDYKVLMTTDYTVDGVRIADTLDGQVTVSSGYNTVSIRQGEQAEVMLDHIAKMHFLRYASARIPRVLIPEALLWATVG